MKYKEIETLISLMKKNGVNNLKYKDKNKEIELGFGEVSSLNQRNNQVVSTESQNDTVEETSNQSSIKAEIIGTFYLSDEEKLEKPLIKEGDQIKKGQTIGFIESMKVMNEVKSNQDGVVSEIKVSHGTPVEFDQVIVTLK